MNSKCLVTVELETGQASASICYQNLVKMLAAMHPAGFKNSVWVAHQSCIPALLSLTIAIGTGGSHYRVLDESNGQFTLLTRPILFSEKLETLGTVGDIILADFSQYAVGLRKELQIDRSFHVHFQEDQTDWRIINRIDGQPLWNEPLTLEDGETQVSPFVCLAAR